MTIPVAPTSPHTEAAIKLIRDLASITNHSVLVDRARQPDGSGWEGEPGVSDFRPYVVLFPAPGMIDGPVAEPALYLDYRVQATCVAATETGAENLADFVRTAWVNVPLDVPGRSSYRGQIMIDQVVTRDDAVSPPVYYTVLQVMWRTQAT